MDIYITVNPTKEYTMKAQIVSIVKGELPYVSLDGFDEDDLEDDQQG